MEYIIDTQSDIAKDLKKMEKRVRTLVDYLYGYFNIFQSSKQLNVVFVEPEYQRQLNRDFRKLDKTTDVLSFQYDDDEILGEIYIDPELAAKQAQKYEVSFENEIIRLVIHGFLHIMGIDHGTTKSREEMFALQENIIAGFNNKNGL